MEEYKQLLYIRFAEEVMGWEDIQPSRVEGKLKFYGMMPTNRGPRRAEVPDYSNDLSAIWGAEQYLQRLGLGAAYLDSLCTVTGAHDLSDPEDLFRLVTASPAQRCEAALAAHRLRRL